jgi:hypothetical protein
MVFDMDTNTRTTKREAMDAIYTLQSALRALAHNQAGNGMIDEVACLVGEANKLHGLERRVANMS